MKKIILLFLFILIAKGSYAQNAIDYFPSNLGKVWYSEISVLDSLNQPIDSLSFYEADSFAVHTICDGCDGITVLSAYSPKKIVRFTPYFDTTRYKFEGAIAYQYLNISTFLDSAAYSVLDSGLVASLDSLNDFYPLFDFSATVGQSQEIFSKEFTLNNDSVSQDMKIKITATRLADEDVSLPVGNFSTKKFKYTVGFYFVMQILPPPLPPQEVPFFIEQNFINIAPGEWIVKKYLPTKFYDFSQIGGPAFYLNGQLFERTEKPKTSKVEENELSPKNFALSQNFPNPFGGSSLNSQTEIDFKIPNDSFVSLKLYDVLGREVRTLFKGFKPKGKHSYYLDAGNLNSGVYFYSLEFQGEKIIRKLTIIR